MEQVSRLCYVGCYIMYKVDQNIGDKLNKFQTAYGTIWWTPTKKHTKEIWLKFYKMMDVSVLLFGSETGLSGIQHVRKIYKHQWCSFWDPWKLMQDWIGSTKWYPKDVKYSHIYSEMDNQPT